MNEYAKEEKKFLTTLQAILCELNSLPDQNAIA